MQSTNAVFRRDDPNFHVRVEYRRDRGTYRVRAWRTAQGKDTQTFHSKQDALRAAHEIWRAYEMGLFFENPKLNPITLFDLCEAFLAREELRPATIRTAKVPFKLLQIHFGAEKSYRGITRKGLEQWLSSMTCKPVSKQSYLRAVRSLFSWAIDNGWLKVNPAIGITIKVVKELRPYLEPHEHQAFLNACNASHRIRAQFVLETGLRTSELIHAQWDWLMFGKDGLPLSIRIEPDQRSGFVPKHCRRRAVPLSKRAFAALDQAKQKWGSDGFIFSKSFLISPNFSRSNKMACTAAGLKHVDFHGLRRSAGCAWLVDGFSIYQVSKLLGHSSVTTTENHYAGMSHGQLLSSFQQFKGTASKKTALPVPETLVFPEFMG